MSSITSQPASTLDSRRWLDRLLAIEIPINAEIVAYGLLFAAAFALHFWDLGARALHHDESLHATYSYYLYRGSGYKHDPLMHGPVLFHLTALMYLLFGVTDATARFSAAFAGIALTFTPLFLRRWLGRWGTLAACTMLLFSPAILYYGRFIREDIFVALWTVGLFIGVWRYLQEGRVRWMYMAAGSLALGFANKELTFIVAAVVLVYIDALLALTLANTIAGRSISNGGGGSAQSSWAARAGWTAILLPTAWALVALWGPLRTVRKRLGLSEIPRSGDLLIVIGTFTLPQLAALSQIPLKHLHVDLSQPAGTFFGSPMTSEAYIGGLVVVLLLAASMAVGLAWNWRRWLASALVFYAIYICLFTTFFTNPNGIATGIWGSLDYWLAQQGVERGGQPVFYYFMMLPLYAYIPVVLSIIGIVYRAARGGRTNMLYLLGSLVMLPILAAAYAWNNSVAIPLVIVTLALLVAALNGDPLRQMLATWFGGVLFGLSVAGEKMPWLTIHLEIPLIFLAALTVSDLISAVLAYHGRAGAQNAPDRRWWVIGLAAGVGLVISVVFAWGPGSDGAHAAGVGLAVLAVAATGILVARRTSPGLGLAVATAALVGLLAPLSLRTAFTLSYQHGDTPYEALVYTQTTPDIPKILGDIRQYASESGLGYNQPIVVDSNDAFSWPWAWYLRDYHQVSYTDMSTYTTGGSSYRPPAHSILLLNNVDRGVMQQYRGQFGTGIPYHHRWWFPEDYRGTTSTSLLSSLTKPSTWATWWGLLAGAHGIVQPPAADAPGVHVIGSVDATAYFPADYVPGSGLSAVPEQGPVAKTSASGALIMGGPGSEAGAFLRPAGIAVDGSGNMYVADSQNNRIQKFNSAGKLVGSSTDASAPGGFQEPWDVAVDPQGVIYVADTWNHRIVKLDPQMHFLTAWGYPTKPSGPDSLLALYGPRAIAFTPSGNLLVTDTGNSRVIEFTPDGKPVGSFGSHGSDPGQFQEPVGIAVAPNGTIYVADSWNGRVQVFDASQQYLRSLPVSGWENRDIENKPYLTLLPNGNLLLSQPFAGRLLELSSNGSTIRDITSAGGDTPLTRPIGVAADPSGKVYVSDGGSNQVIRQSYAALP
jgi:uncharacterized protein (TIGR03663 family)